MSTTPLTRCCDYHGVGVGPCAERTAKQSRLRDLCDEIANHDGISTFHFKCLSNDGVDCEYEYLNEDATIYAVELIRLTNIETHEAYGIIVKRSLRDDAGDRTNRWVIESTSTMEAV